MIAAAATVAVYVEDTDASLGFWVDKVGFGVKRRGYWLRRAPFGSLE